MTWPKGTNGAGHGGPARGGPAKGTWKQFEPTHGAKSERKIRPVADALIEELLEHRTDLANPRFGPSLQAWAVAEAKCVLYREYADQVGIINEQTGEPLGYVSGWRTAESQAESRRRELGIGPYAEAKLLSARAEASLATGDLELIVGPGRELLEARERRLRLERGRDQAAEG